MKVRKLSILWVMSTSPFILFSRRGTECAESDTIDTYFVCREAHVNVLEDAEFFSSFSVLSHKKKSFFFRFFTCTHSFFFISLPPYLYIGVNQICYDLYQFGSDKTHCCGKQRYCFCNKLDINIIE